MNTAPEIPQIEGLTRTVEAAKINKGHLTPPPEFDSKKYAGKWVKHAGGNIEKAQQETILDAGALGRYTVAGWQIFRHKGQVTKRSLSDGQYILMFRPRELQSAVAAICGNISKARIIKEHSGETIQGEQRLDQGMLDPMRLQMLEPNPNEPDLAFQFNKIKPLNEAGAAQATAQPKHKR